jgi:hypothetical protein
VRFVEQGSICSGEWWCHQTFHSQTFPSEHLVTFFGDPPLQPCLDHSNPQTLQYTDCLTSINNDSVGTYSFIPLLNGGAMTLLRSIYALNRDLTCLSLFRQLKLFIGGQDWPG